MTFPLDDAAGSVLAASTEPVKPRKVKAYWTEYAAIIADVMTRVLARPITPWVIAGPQSYVAKAFATHAKDHATGKRLEGEAFRAWLGRSVEAWLEWRARTDEDDARALPAALRDAWWKSESALGWVKWLDAGAPRASSRGVALPPRRAPVGYRPPRV